MPSREELIAWFDDIGKSRKDLPYELIKVFSDDEIAELNKSVGQSFDHIERVFLFSKILQFESNDQDDLWAYLQATLDDSSYYACLALPLLRQLLEPSVNFFYADADSINLKKWEGTEKASIPDVIASLPNHQRVLAIDVWELAHNINELNRQFLLLSSSRELIVWAKYFLECCARLVLIAAKLAK